VVRRSDGKLALRADVVDSAAIDWVLCMAPVTEGNFLDVIVLRDALTPQLQDALGDCVASYHAKVAAVSRWDSLGALLRVAKGNARSALEAGLPTSAIDHSRPLILAIGGLPGTGKSTLARLLAPELGAAPGALVLRSDEIRKRVHGVAPEDRLPESAYGEQTSAKLSKILIDQACVVAKAGHAVVLDATFPGSGAARGPACRSLYGRHSVPGPLAARAIICA
jgi:hypothetical protein